jgi:hypothetical protein
MITDLFTEASVTYDGSILYMKYHEGVIIDEHILMRGIQFRKKMTGTDSFFMLFDMSDAADITECALAFAADHPSPENIKAIGVITRKGQDYIRAKLYTVFDKPNIHTKPFLLIDDAKEWFKGLEVSATKAA